MIQPTPAAVRVAKRALERRKTVPRSKRGGLDARQAHEQGIGSGVMRARDIASGKKVNAYQVKAFFDRHRHNYVKARADGKRWEDSKAWQAWDLWGGEPLRKQVEREVAKDKRQRRKNPSSSYDDIEIDYEKPECDPLIPSERIKRVPLTDASILAKKFPDKFKRPDISMMRLIKPGAFVKVNVNGERIWLKVTGYEKRRYHGAVMNLPLTERLDLGDRIYFQKRNVYNVIERRNTHA